MAVQFSLHSSAKCRQQDVAGRKAARGMAVAPVRWFLARSYGDLPALAEFSFSCPRISGRLVAAYENCLRILNLSDRSDPTTELIAKKAIEVAQTRGDRHVGWQRSRL